MSIAVTRTKLHVPRRRADLLSRTRLISALADLLEYPFTLISAPAGYGKTCLMIDLAHQASYPVCWYAIDPLDRDPKRFLGHFIHAIKEEFPDFGKSSLDLLDNLNNPLSSPDQFTSTLVNDIYDSISENFAIFMDDLHLLDDHPQINRFISCFGQRMDENTHLVMSSRKVFNFPDLPLLIGRKLVKGVDQNDLAFQPHELRDYFQSSFQQFLSEKDATEMVKNTSGWITGLLLGRESQQSLFPGQNKAARVSGADLNSYFADQVYLKQPAPIRKLMLRTSLFDTFNPAFCEEVLGEPESISFEDFFNTLTEQNLFVEQVEDNGIWVRYHHLFRDYLYQELEKQLPGEKQILLSKLANYHLGSGNWENAFDAARQLKDPVLMGDVINTAFGPLFHAGRIKLLSDWLEILPEEGYLACSILVLLKGICVTSLGNPERGLEILSLALENKEIQANQNHFYRGLICRATASRLIGNYHDALSDIELILSNPPLQISNTTILAEAQRETALCKYHLGNFHDSISLFQSSLDSYKAIGDINNSALVHSDLGCVLMAHGQLKQAEFHFHQAKEIWNRLENINQLAILLNNIASLSNLFGEHTKSNEMLLEAESYSIKTHNSRIRSFIIGSKGDLALSVAKYKKAHSFYRKAEDIAIIVQEQFLSSYFPIFRATCYRYQKNPSQAKTILTKHRESILHGLSQYERGLWYLEWSFAHLDQNESLISQESFQTARLIFLEANRPFELAKSLLGLAITAKRQADKKALNDYSRELAQTLSEVETLHPLLPEFSQHLDDIDQMASEPYGLEIFQSCRDQINLYLKELPEIQSKLFPPAEIDGAAARLEIRAFGETSVRLDGKRITASEWIHQKTAREIFFYLLSHPRGVTKEQVGVTFWPDSSPSQLSCQFKNAMYRLRRALGKEVICFHQESRSYSFNRDCRYEYDVERFQEALGQAENQTDQECKVDHLRQAVSLYKHPFGPQLGGTWAEPQRRRLYIEYEKAQLEIAAYALQAKNFPACRDACLAVLALEPCQEKAYQLCMRAYSGLCDLTEIHRTIEKCKYNFNKHLGIRPSKITLNLYKELTNN